MKFLKCLMILLMFSVVGCDMIVEKMNILSDEKIKLQVVGNFGYFFFDFIIILWCMDGINIFVNVVINDRKEFNCIINGGNLFIMGMFNLVVCMLKG